MKIIHALNIKKGETVAFIGAGGKTGAMFALALELAEPIVFTTTTHLGVWQAENADQHVIVEKPEEIDDLELLANRRILITGPANENNRLTAPDGPVLNRIHERCRQEQITFLIEADGARQRSLKAPADYEPVVPEWIDSVVVMAGVKGIGKPLNEEWVHRPEIFSELSGRAIGDTIRVEDVIKVLGDRQGGLKGIPDGAKRFLFLSQADEPKEIAQASRIAQALLSCYDRVLIGNLSHRFDGGPIYAAKSRVAGVVLAAGGSKRLGQPKQLLDWQGEPFISKIIKTGLESGLSPLVVVTGAEHELIEGAIGDLPVRIVYNSEWEAGQSGSMQRGLDALPEDCDAVMLILGDQPQLSSMMIRQLIEHYFQHRKVVTAPMVNNQRGNPVLFGRAAFDQLQQVTGDQGGRAVIRHYEVDWLPWIDDRVLLDVDAERELDRLVKAFFGNSK